MVFRNSSEISESSAKGLNLNHRKPLSLECLLSIHIYQLPEAPPSAPLAKSGSEFLYYDFVCELQLGVLHSYPPVLWLAL